MCACNRRSYRCLNQIKSHIRKDEETANQSKHFIEFMWTMCDDKEKINSWINELVDMVQTCNAYLFIAISTYGITYLLKRIAPWRRTRRISWGKTTYKRYQQRNEKTERKALTAHHIMINSFEMALRVIFPIQHVFWSWVLCVLYKIYCWFD